MLPVYSHLRFTEVFIPKRKTRFWQVRSRHDDFLLGSIEYKTGWRQYVFSPTAEPSVWSDDCLFELATAVKEANKTRERGQ